MSLPTNPYVPTSAFYGRAVISFTPAGSETALVIEAEEAEYNPNIEFAEQFHVDANGVKRLVRRDVKQKKEVISSTMSVAKTLPSIFGTALGGAVSGVATVFMENPTDASGHVSLQSQAGFACTLHLDGAIKFGNGEYTLPKLTLTSTQGSDIAWTVDGTVS
jgi:hypothetical protein